MNPEIIKFKTQVHQRGNGKSIIAQGYTQNKADGRGGFFYHPENLDISIGERDRIIYVSPDCRGHGLATKIGQKLIEIAYYLNLDPRPEFFSLSIFHQIGPMIRVAEKLGFWQYELLSTDTMFTYLKPFNPNT
ncbi:GNAT family N-acetyltransferase [Candidatus Pacearchaeota archaeon]|nr:GNAT family N-acetyltransferase [Candidatus Pacearchaeota archaeon]